MIFQKHKGLFFRHLGVERGGKIPDSALSASSIRNEYYEVPQGRLNTPENAVVTDIGDQTVGIGGGHGAWKPAGDDKTTSYYQVDFELPTEVKGIITQVML